MSVRELGTMIWVEVTMQMKTDIKCLSSTVSEFILYTFAYLAVVIFGAVKGMNAFYHTNLGVVMILIGFMFWNMGVVAMDESTLFIETGARTGILETEIQSRFSLWFIALVRSWVTDIYYFVYLLILSVITAFVISVPVLQLVKADVLVFVIAIISNVGMLGIGLLCGAGSLRFKRVGNWSSILQSAILFVANVAMPNYFGAQLLLPFGAGIEITRHLFLGQSVSLNLIGIYFGVNVIWFALGLVVFCHAMQKERRIGSFDRF
ncbi:hypothetical protein [Furfurilactobacillus milii]|uniref:Uncharacterized protein n=1 Tax=Furfurilactobacillus rossiae TaxID=231049 RepID=A0A7C9MZM3_9LACO|nr:hypothetical protein [Furfurilactobacillus milii]MYV06287.1 hypothetical protein [Furfurilactobacillus milii]